MFLGSMLCYFVNNSKLWIFTNCSELFAAILRLFEEFSTFFQRFSTKIKANAPMPAQNKNSCKSLTHRSFGRVPGRTRTVDIQNHNLTL